MDRDKTFPGKMRMCDLLNQRYITRYPIYNFLVNNSDKIVGKMLDYGCGSMQYRSIFNNSSEYVGLDIEGADENGFVPDKSVVYYDGRHIPFADNTFDSAISIEVFEHVEDIGFGLRELSRVIKRGGVLLITVPMTFPLHLEPWDYRRFTTYGLEKMLNENGFDVVKLQKSTSEIDTIRRLKIIEMNRRKSRFTKIYTLYANWIFSKKRNNLFDDSKLPVSLLVECKNHKKEYEY